MPVERVFLGWNEPCLHLATTWLRQRYVPDAHGSWDLSRVLVVLPGERAVRRLQELLVIEATCGLIVQPPRIITQGRLPEQLFESPQPVVDELTSLLTWAYALRESERDAIAPLVPVPPEEGDTLGWLATAQNLAAVVRELAAEGLRPGDVLPRLEGLADFPDAQRWDALTQCHARYAQILERQGLTDDHAARFNAIAQQRCRVEGDVVLIGCVDLPGIAAMMLRQLATPIVALVHASPDEADAFDELGTLRPDGWAERHVDIEDNCISVVESPREQAQEVVRVLERLGSDYAADQITIGLGDDTQAAPIHRTLELADLPARSAMGSPIPGAAPLRLLTALGRFIGSRRFDDLAALLRHPDIEAYINDTHGIAMWLTLLDRYANDHLQRRVTGQWLGRPQTQEKLKQVHDAVVALLPHEPDERRPLPTWAAPIADALARVYERRPLQRHGTHDRRVIAALTHIGGVLREMASLDADAPITPRVTVAEAVRLLTTRLAQLAIPEPGGDPAIELLGWLELPMDDAPLLVLTSMNEGHVPASRGPDPWLPNRIRAALGLGDDRRRLARDKLLLTAMQRSRPHLHLIACRRTADGDPIPPSRLLLACDQATQAQRVLRFYDEAAEHAPAAPLLLLPHGSSRFVIPVPTAPAAPLDHLPVTAFADYIACPYRFYLKHVLKLAALDDRAIEMGGDVFGGLAHAVLDAFGRHPNANDEDTRQAIAAIDALLNEQTTIRFGDTPAATVAIQCRQLRDRLHRMAAWHAHQVREGWRVLSVERKLAATLIVDDVPFTITGRIDRIDRHDGNSRHRIIDYKTSDSAYSPDAVHRQGPGDQKQWISLQLPLYRRLARAAGIAGPIDLGFVLLPRDVGRVGFTAADWDDATIDTAEAAAADIIRAIRRGVYWPPRPPRFADDFTGICLDDTLDRAEVLKRMREVLR